MNTPIQLDLEHSFADDLEGLYAPWTPKGFPKPSLLILNRPLAAELGIDPAWIESHGAAVLSGSKVPEGARPIAQAYAGHQFGNFNPQLGDGRALLLGEVVDPSGRRFDLQLKGSGQTPFSRRGDGLAALDSVLREYIVSEAMHGLGIPTTRSLAVVTTGQPVFRARTAPGAVLTRVAASHLRVGTLEFLAVRDEIAKLRQLVDYTLRRHYPDQVGAPNPAKALLDSVATAQGRLIARWMLVGFVHGVMNTDNVTLSGETIDYGPCAFMEAYDPGTVFSGIDQHGRYAYGNQPSIGAWNTARMAEALLPLLAEDQKEAASIGQDAIERFAKTFNAAYREGMRTKLGAPSSGDPADGKSHEKGDLLISELLEWMHANEADFTSTFRQLSRSLVQGKPAFDDPAFVAWNDRWRARLGDGDPVQIAEAMDRVNPIYIPRNQKIEEALDAALEGDLNLTHRLAELVSRPYDEQPYAEEYAGPASRDFGPYRTHCNT